VALPRPFRLLFHDNSSSDFLSAFFVAPILGAFPDVLLLALLFATPAPKMFLAGVAVTLAAAKT